jgi:cell division protein YceG involved in septum cleavage
MGVPVWLLGVVAVVLVLVLVVGLVALVVVALVCWAWPWCGAGWGDSKVKKLAKPGKLVTPKNGYQGSSMGDTLQKSPVTHEIFLCQYYTQVSVHTSICSYKYCSYARPGM